MEQEHKWWDIFDSISRSIICSKDVGHKAVNSHGNLACSRNTLIHSCSYPQINCCKGPSTTSNDCSMTISRLIEHGNCKCRAYKVFVKFRHYCCQRESIGRSAGLRACWFGRRGLAQSHSIFNVTNRARCSCHETYTKGRKWERLRQVLMMSRKEVKYPGTLYCAGYDRAQDRAFLLCVLFRYPSLVVFKLDWHHAGGENANSSLVGYLEQHSWGTALKGLSRGDTSAFQRQHLAGHSLFNLSWMPTHLDLQ